MRASLLLILALVVAPAERAADTLVRTAAEFADAVARARPGDTITMANGTWHDVVLTFDADGTEGDSITLRAETPGRVILAGSSRLRIGGSYLKVEGLWFHRGALAQGHVIAFRTNRPAHHSRITQCAVTEYNPADWLLQYKWLSLYGTHNRVDHCYFAGKTHDGATLVVWLADPPDDAPNYHRIDHNHFGPRPRLGKNGGETIRIGTSHRSMQDSYSLVEHNLFERTDGEHEIISNKSGNNTYRHNTFLEASGALTLRHGNHATVTQNYFLGGGQPGTGGVRIIGEDHVVSDNYFADLRGDSSRASLSVMNGIPDSPLNRYFQVKRPVVARNTFVGTKISILYGLGADGEKTLPPIDVTFAGNVILADGSAPVITTLVSAEDVAWQGNVIHGANLGIPATEGIQWQDPILVQSEDGLWRPAPDGPASGKGASLAVPPQSAENVGSAWWGQSWTPEVLSDSLQHLPDFSYAGYAWGERPLPVHGATLHVTDFGATGDDMADDTEAFLRALEAAHALGGLVVLAIPEGRFHLSGIMFLERDSLVVQGSGTGKTLIYVESPLGALDVPEGLAPGGDAGLVQGRNPSPYSDRGGVFWSRVPLASAARQATPILEGKRGRHELRIPANTTEDLTAEHRIAWSGERTGDGRGRTHYQDVAITGRDGDVLLTREPLAADLAPEMNPRLEAVNRLTEVGIEHLTIEFERVPYGGHGLEDGYNALYLAAVRHGWVRSVEIRNADAAIILDESSQVTLQDISIQGRNGHIGVQLQSTGHSLVQGVRILPPFEHSLSSTGSSAYNVFTRIAARNVHDSAEGHANLYDHLTLNADGSEDRIWQLAAGSRPVFWDVHMEYVQPRAMRTPAYVGGLGQGAVAVALSGNVPIRLDAHAGTYLEGTNVPGLAVPSLYGFQSVRRLNRGN